MALHMMRPTLGSVGRALSAPIKRADPFYESVAWRGFASAIKQQRGYRCEGCGKDCSRSKREMIADHIIERRDGGADFDPLNVQTLCIGCHNRKTAQERARRGPVT